jgi:mannose-1-phosphate guanylyltransferase
MGTRMGLIGQHLPKPLWPIFEKSLLEIQLSFIDKYSPKKIFINTHHCHELLERVIKTKEQNIEILHEPTLLGVGGAIHNVKMHHPSGRLLVINSDQLYLMSENDEKDFLKKSLKFHQLLLSVDVGAESNYNKLIIDENGLLTEIKKNCHTSAITYSGVSIVNLEEISYMPGFSNFFDSVANYKNGKVGTFFPKEKCEYWDFGTLKLYLSNIKKIAALWNHEDVEMLRHVLLTANAVKPLLLAKNGYRGLAPGYFNFSNEAQPENPNTFILGKLNKKKLKEFHLYYHDFEMSSDSLV